MNPTRFAPAVKFVTPLLVSALGLFASCGCQGRTSAGDPAAQQITLNLPQTDGPLVVYVRSDAFETGQEIPREHTAYDKNASPPLAWSGVPEAARSLVVVMEDPDSEKPKPFVHWLVYNIPPDTTRLLQGVADAGVLPEPVGAMQGKNSAGKVGYVGPRPPVDDPEHHYHFQVFALDRSLSLRPGATRDQLLQAMNGHVIAKGQLIGTYRER